MDVGLKNVDMKTNSSAFDLYKLSSPKKEGYIANRCLQYVFKV